MSVQKTVLQQFQEAHPKAKLKEISEKTGIQITRVFRILNGAEMKVTEWEKFKKASQSQTNIDSFTETAKKCSLKLSPQRRKHLQAYMEQALSLIEFKMTDSLISKGLCHEL